MSYKIENGVVYEIKEVNVADIEKEIKQVVAYIGQYEETKKPYISAIEVKKNELNTLIEKYNNEIAKYQNEIDKFNEKIEEARGQLADKKDIVSQLYPNYKDVLGF